MAIETFRWMTERGQTSEINYRTRESRFGGGYRQTVGDGPNNREDSYPVSLNLSKGQAMLVIAFLDRHGGARAFLWKTPLGELGLFTCKDPKPTPIGGNRFKITATFERAFHP